MIANVADVANVLADNSRVTEAFYHKAGSPVSAAGIPIDLSMAAGTPKFNAYVGDQLAFTPMVGSGNNGIYTGQATSGLSKFLAKWDVFTTGATNVAGAVWLLDYVGYWPLVDMDSLDLQVMDNTLAPTRNVDGAGLRLMLVVNVPYAASADATISYTNQAGVSGRTITFSVGAATAQGNIVTGGNASFATSKVTPFLPLASGDTGVRSVESFQMSASAGGFSTLVLVRPLSQIVNLSNVANTEKNFITEQGCRPIAIASDAYLNMVALSSGAPASAVWRGSLTTVLN